MNTAGARAAATRAERSRTFRIAARAGYVVLGLVHVLIGAIAVSVATDSGGGEADQSGAMKQLAQSPPGVIALWVTALGLFALTLWQLAQGVRVNAADAPKRWGRRLAALSKAVVYAVLGVSSLVFALGGRSSSQHRTQGFSAMLLAAPGGALVVTLIGLIVFAIGIGFVVIGVMRKFEKQLHVPRRPIGTAVRVVGVTGYLAKGVALGIVGVLFVIASITHDSEQAGGLDAGLKSLQQLQPYGEVLLWVIGAGLIVYGVYCGVRAALARMDAA